MAWPAIIPRVFGKANHGCTPGTDLQKLRASPADEVDVLVNGCALDCRARKPRCRVCPQAMMQGK